MIFPPILNSYSPMKGYMFVIFLNKRSKGLTMQIYFHSLLCSYLSLVPTILTTCVCVCVRACVRVYIYIYIYICVCVCVCVCIYVSVVCSGALK